MIFTYLTGQCQSHLKDQEGHDGPEIAHLNIETLHDKEQVSNIVNYKKRRYKIIFLN
jgi:hypothetical protein